MSMRFLLPIAAVLAVLSSAAHADCTALTNGVIPVPTPYLDDTITKSRALAAASTGFAASEGSLAYDTVADLLKVCDGTVWQSLSGGSVSADSLDFTEFKDAMTLDASTDIAASGTNVLSISNTGTGNSFLVNDAASDTTPFVIDAAGNVGIGTTAPSYLLDINGNARVSGIIIAGSDVWVSPSQQLYLNTGTGLSMNGGGGNLSFNFSWSPKVIFTSAGNIGIGTTAPTNLLSLGGDAARTIWMERSATAAATGNSLTLQAGGTKSGNTDQNGGDLVLSSGTATGTGSSNITFKTASAGTTGTTDRAPTTAMTILGNGNVGIGTSNPAKMLDVKIASHGDGIRIQSAGTYVPMFRIGSENASGRNWGITVDDANFGGMDFRVSNAAQGDPFSAGAIKMSLLSSGNVGIGTTSPGSTLDVKGTLRLSGATSGYVGLAPATAAGSTTYTLPSTDGTNGQFLKTNGSGTLSWGTGSAAATTGTLCGMRSVWCNNTTPVYDSYGDSVQCNGATLTVTCTASAITAFACPSGYTGKKSNFKDSDVALSYYQIVCVAN